MGRSLTQIQSSQRSNLSWPASVATLKPRVTAYSPPYSSRTLLTRRSGLSNSVTEDGKTFSLTPLFVTNSRGIEVAKSILPATASWRHLMVRRVGSAVAVGQLWTQSGNSVCMRVRAGVHTGECEVIGKKLGGITVHIGARIGALAAPDEVLVSYTCDSRRFDASPKSFGIVRTLHFRKPTRAM